MCYIYMCGRVCVKIINVYFAVPTHSEPLCVQSKAQVMLPNRQVASKCGASHADNVELIKCVLVATSVSSSVLCVCRECSARCHCCTKQTCVAAAHHLLGHNSLILIEQ